MHWFWEGIFCEVGLYVPAHFPGALGLRAETPELAKVEAAMIWHRWEATPFGRREADGYRIVDNMHSRLETRYFRGAKAPDGCDINPRQLALPGFTVL